MVVFYNFLPFPSPRGRTSAQREKGCEGGRKRRHYLAYFDIAAQDQRDPFALRPRFTIDPRNREVEDREAPTISEMSIPVSETRYWFAVTGASLSRAPIVLELYGNNDEYIETADR